MKINASWLARLPRCLGVVALTGLAGCGWFMAPPAPQPWPEDTFGAFSGRLHAADSRSIDLPSNGHLDQGESLLDFTQTGYFLHRGEHPFGTNETVRYLVGAGRTLVDRVPGSAVFLVRDLSQWGGGRLSGHASHQSGRDADVGYMALGNRQLEHFIDMDTSNFDAAKNWIVFKALLQTHQVKYIFMDYELQKLLYPAAVAAGEPRELLDREFQYPRPLSERAGLIRHWPNHKNHLHVRFLCPAGDLTCRDPETLAPHLAP